MKCILSPKRMVLAGAALSLLVAGVAGGGVAHAQTVVAHTVAVVTLTDDDRYKNRRLERHFPGHPGGRPLVGAELGASDAEASLHATGQALKVVEASAASAAELPQVLNRLKADRVAYWVLDLPDSVIPQVVKAAGSDALLFNIGASSDALRAQDCGAQLFHTYPSQAMLNDALAQYLAARSWRNALVLQGPTSADAAMGQAWSRASERYGIKVTATKPFKLSGDPRERDLANPRLLTSDRNHDVVVVVDADGEFARTLPYATQQPRPVVGANGLVVLAWHSQWERNGGPQVNRRFVRAAQRPMTGHDWAAWVAVKAVAAVVTENPKATPAEQARLLRSGKVFVDGAKGRRLSFRAWDGQLRQPLFLSHVDGVVGTAPLDGVLHPTEVMDTLGVDEKESACKARP
jgi:ABC transporter substrate binding protein (PQQ-dependent alcohol dehydrogenase system)